MYRTYLRQQITGTPSAVRLRTKRSCEFPGSGFSITCQNQATKNHVYLDMKTAVRILKDYRNEVKRIINLKLSMPLEPIRIFPISTIVWSNTWLHIPTP